MQICEDKKMYCNNTKSFLVLPKIEDLTSIHPIKVKGRVGKTITITLLDFSNETNNLNFTSFDQLVANAAYSISIDGSETFTLSNIVERLTGNRDVDLTDKRTKIIWDSLEKMSTSKLDFDTTEECRARKIINNDKRRIDNKYFLPVESSRTLNNCGVESVKFFFVKKPPIYEFAEKTNQIVSYPISLLDNGIRKEVETIVIEHNIIRRIELMKNPKNGIKSNRIMLERYDKNKKEWTGFFYELCFIKNGEMYSLNSDGKQTIVNDKAKKRTKINKTIISILDSLVAKEYIEAYEILKRGKTIVGYEISLRRKVAISNPKSGNIQPEKWQYPTRKVAISN